MKRRHWIKLTLGASALATLGWRTRESGVRIVPVAHASTFFAPHVADRLVVGARLDARPVGKRQGVWLDDFLLGYLPGEFADKTPAFVRCERIGRDPRGRLQLHVAVGQG